MCAMEGKSRKNIWKELKEKFLLTYEVMFSLVFFLAIANSNSFLCIVHI